MSHEGEALQGQEPLDRKAMLLEQFNAEEVAPAEPVKTDAAPAAQPDGRARDELGKFVPKEKTAAAAPAQQPELAPAALEPWQTAPTSWKPHLRDGWSKLDPAYQRYVHEREQEMRAGVEPLLPKAELADKMMKAAEPYMGTIRGLGIDLPQAVEGLMRVDHQLRTLPFDQKVAVLQNVAASYGVDLSGQMQTAQPAYSPAVQQTQNELIALKGQFQNFLQQQEQALQAGALDEIQRFSKSAEYFDEVKPTMIQLLQSGMAVTIEDAYEKAIRFDPDLFEKIHSSRQAAVDTEKRKAADDAAKKAKAAAVSVKTATPGSKTPTNAQDRRSMLREQLDGLSERL